MGRKDNERIDQYVQTWQFEPLPIATLAAITPKDIEISYFDERVERINFDDPTDLAAITVETYTAKRAYEIAAQFHKRGVPTILGGYHVMLMPEEAAQYADSIFIGYPETRWTEVLKDVEQGILKRRYVHDRTEPHEFVIPDRNLLARHKYFPLSNVETGRGCPYRCNFCSIAAAHSSTYAVRPIDSVVEEVAGLKNKRVFFVEDNFVGNPNHTKDLCRALAPLKIQWMGQGTLTMAKDEELLKLMADSGCLGMLIGFESLKPETLRLMDKRHNITKEDYKNQIRKIHQHGIALYGTFVFGYDTEMPEDIVHTAEAAIDFGIFMSALNHLVPFPGTPLYEQFKEKGRMPDENWWLSPSYRFGDVAFTPTNMTADELHEQCLAARRKFYSFPSIIRRAAKNPKGNLWPPFKIAGYPVINHLLRREINEKDGLPLGNEPVRPTPLYPADEQIPFLPKV